MYCKVGAPGKDSSLESPFCAATQLNIALFSGQKAPPTLQNLAGQPVHKNVAP